MWLSYHETISSYTDYAGILEADLVYILLYDVTVQSNAY